MPSVNVEIFCFDDLSKSAKKRAIENHRHDSDQDPLVYPGDIFCEPYEKAGIALEARDPIYWRLYVQGSYAYPNVKRIDPARLMKAAGVDGRAAAARELSSVGLIYDVDPRYGFNGKIVPADMDRRYSLDDEMTAALNKMTEFVSGLNRVAEAELQNADMERSSDEVVADMLSSIDIWFLVDGTDAPDKIVDRYRSA